MENDRIYTKDFLLSFRTKYAEPPLLRFHPVYIKQKRVPHSSTVDTKDATASSTTSKWSNLEAIRTFSSSDNSFIQRTRNRSASEVLIGEIRSLLNKLSDKTFESIKQQLQNIDYSKFDKNMETQVIKVFIAKFIADISGRHTKQYTQIGIMFATTFPIFKTELQNICNDIFTKIFNNASLGDIQKSKGIGLMRILPYITHSLIPIDFVEKNILEPIIQEINKRKNIETSYANITSTGGCGLYIELLCKFCEQCPHTNIKTHLEIQHLIELLTEISNLKTVPARVRFIAEDTLELIK